MSNKSTSNKPVKSLNAIKKYQNSHCTSPSLIIYISFSSVEIKLYKGIIRFNHRVKLAQHPLKMLQYISRCLLQLIPASWCKGQLELFPAASLRPTSTIYLGMKLLQKFSLIFGFNSSSTLKGQQSNRISVLNYN